MQRIIAAYTAAPADPAAAARYYDTLMQIPEGDGFELAWSGPTTAATLDPLLKRLPASWVVTINDIPATWRACTQMPVFGLASPDAAGRAAAMAMLRDMNTGIKAMNDSMGRKVVLAAEIHCAPGFDKRVVEANASAFRNSLDEAAGWDWDGCSVMVEHCDAFVPGQQPAKGFLPLREEIEVLGSLAGTPVGLSLNWGRSLVEVHDPARVMDHVVEGANAGLLRGFTFSGSAGSDNVFGAAWGDSHLPFAMTKEGRYGEPASLMRQEHVEPVLPYLDACEFIAIKTNWPAARTDPLERAASVSANFYTLLALLQQHKLGVATATATATVTVTVTATA